MKSTLLALTLILSGILGCAPTDPGALTEADRTAIREASLAWLEAYHDSDFATLADMYTEDAILMPPNQPSIVGRENIRKWFQENETGFSISLTYVEIEGFGSLAYVRGTYQLTIPVEGQAPQTDIGKLLDIRRRSGDGAWLISRDMFSSDRPLE